MQFLLCFLITQFCCVYTAVILNGECQNPCIKQRTCQVTHLSGKCYYIFKDKERSWSENKDLCSANNLTMVRITKEDIKNGLSLPNDLTDQEYVWLGGSANDLESWMFSNGVLLEETHFSKPPEDGPGLDHCGTVTDGLINDKTACRNKIHFLCRFDDWQGVPSIYLSEATGNWFEAISRCNDMGGDIFYLNKNEDGQFLNNKLDPSKRRTFYIGLSTTYWQWENKELIRYFNWMSGDPNDFSEKCLAMYAKDGLWVDHNCDLKMHGLCQGAPAVVRPTGIPPTELDGNNNAGLKAALVIFILSTIGLAAAIIVLKRHRLQWLYRNLRGIPQPEDAKSGSANEPLLNEDVRELQETIKKLQEKVENKNESVEENLMVKLKGKTDQQMKHFINEQLEDELKKEKENMDENVTKLREKKERDIEEKKRDQAHEYHRMVTWQNSYLGDKEKEDRIKEIIEYHKRAIEEKYKAKAEELNKNDKKKNKNKIKSLDNEKKAETDKMEMEIKSKEYWDLYVQKMEKKFQSERDQINLRHNDEIKLINEEGEKRILQIKEQHDRQINKIEEKIKKNKQEIENMEKDLEKRSEKKSTETKIKDNKQQIDDMKMGLEEKNEMTTDNNEIPEED